MRDIVIMLYCINSDVIYTVIHSAFSHCQNFLLKLKTHLLTLYSTKQYIENKLFTSNTMILQIS